MLIKVSFNLKLNKIIVRKKEKKKRKKWNKTNFCLKIYYKNRKWFNFVTWKTKHRIEYN